MVSPAAGTPRPLLVVVGVVLCAIVGASAGSQTIGVADPGRTESVQEYPRQVTRDQVRRALDPDEPNYADAARLGPAALSHLEELIAGADVGLASKAVYLASLIRDRRSSAVVRKGAMSRRAEVRVAAAAGARNLPRNDAIDVLTGLLRDGDAGVREVALKSIRPTIGSQAPPAAVRERLESLADGDPQPHIRALAREILDRPR